MTGKSHKAIGIATGVAFMVYGLRQGNTAFLLGTVSAPLTAMLPDIDHGGSRIGKTRKMVANIVVAILLVAVIAFAWTYSWYIDSYRTLLFVLVVFASPIIMIFGISQTKFGRSTIGFITKHRGIMHTLLLPIFMFLSVGLINDIYFQILILGACLGYFSHIIADCLTTNGCPVLFPISKRNISLLKIKTGSFIEKICVLVIIMMILALGFLIS